MKEKLRHRNYSAEFKVQAVKLALNPDLKTKDVAESLDIHPFMLSRWKKLYREGKIKVPKNTPRIKLKKVIVHKVRGSGKAARLERELKTLKIEHDLLKKAIRFSLEKKKKSSSL